MMDTLLALLIAFPGVPLPERVPPAVHDALVDLAARLDLSTPAENWNNYPFRSGVRWCHNILLELKDAPPSADYVRFPDTDFCAYELARNEAYGRELTAWGEFASWRWEAAQAAQGEACYRWQVWHLAREASRGYSIAARRQNLARLRALLEDDGYILGLLPPGVPD